MKTYASLTQDERLEIIRLFRGEAAFCYDPLQAAAIVARRFFRAVGNNGQSNAFAIVLAVVAMKGVVDVRFTQPVAAEAGG